MKRLQLVGFAALLLAAAGGGPSNGGAEDTASRKEEATLPIDLEGIPRGSLGFVSIRVADLWGGPLGKAIRDKLPKEHAFAPEIEKALGVPLDAVERLTVVAVESPRDPPLLAVAVNRDVERKQVLAALVPEAKSSKHGKHTVHANAGRALCFLDDRNFLAGPTDLVRQALARAEAGALDDALGEAAKKHAVVLVVNLPALIRVVPPIPQPEDEPFKPVLKARTVLLTVDVAEGIDAVVSLRFAGDEEARSGEKAGRELLKHFRAILDASVKEMAGRKDRAALADMGRLVQKTLDDIRLEQKGSTVHAKVKVKTVAVLFEPLVGAIVQARQAAERAQRANNLKQIGLAFHNYHDVNGRFPPAALYNKDGKAVLSWRVLLLPYLDEDELYKEFHLDEPWDSPHNKKLLARMPKVFDAPSAGPAPRHTTFYQVFVGRSAAFEGKAGVPIASFTDGTSNTILVIEGAKAVLWSKPEDLPFDPDKPLPKVGGVYPNGAHAVFADGSVRFLKKSMKEATLRALITRNVGDLPGSDY
jgi:hypothetical protein